jgi:RHS repeat-associated protein
VWCDEERREVRNGLSGDALLRQFFEYGETISGTSYYFTRDHLYSVREVTNSSGTIVWQQSFDPYGNPTTIVSTTPADFGYAGYYLHSHSGLNLTASRAYSAVLGRFISRDPIEEDGGVNLYGYVENNPIDLRDPSGLASCSDLAKDITKVRNELAKRADALRRDPLNLPPTGKNSIEGHRHQFRCKQANLRDLLNQYDSKGCGRGGRGGGGGSGIPADARAMSTMPVPQKDPNLAPYTGLPPVVPILTPAPVPVPTVPVPIIPAPVDPIFFDPLLFPI